MGSSSARRESGAGESAEGLRETGPWQGRGARRSTRTWIRANLHPTRGPESGAGSHLSALPQHWFPGSSPRRNPRTEVAETLGSRLLALSATWTPRSPCLPPSLPSAEQGSRLASPGSLSKLLELPGPASAERGDRAGEPPPWSPRRFFRRADHAALPWLQAATAGEAGTRTAGR